MVLHVIGLGLGDCEDITVKGLTRVRSADAVFLECYTSVLGIDKDALVSLSLRRFTFNMMRIILERSFLPMFDFLLGMVPD
jgi:diphthamide biosynthesis methyltransferase